MTRVRPPPPEKTQGCDVLFLSSVKYILICIHFFRLHAVKVNKITAMLMLTDLYLLPDS